MFAKILYHLCPDLKFSKRSYAQCGEDLIVDFVLTNLKIKQPDYLDIGAHHPFYLSNTYFFYKEGATGVCIEPDPDLFFEMQKRRKRDLCIHAGVGITGATEAEFYVMSSKTLNTFSKMEAERLAGYGRQKIEKVIQVPLLPISKILEQHLLRVPNFVSLDVEGLDYDILKSLNLPEWRPEVFCIETITYTEDNTEEKENLIIEYMLSHEYMVYADTYINTIFVDKVKWMNR
jgi:FkbM family methyltransferase